MKLLSLHFLAAALLAQPAPRTVLQESPSFTATRTGRYLVVELNSPHRVLSTSGRTGGQSDEIRYLINHQSMEPVGDLARHDEVVKLTEAEYHNVVSKELGLDPLKTASMGTAANMNYVGYRRIEFRDLRVDAFVTAGVDGNAMRPGDPITYVELAAAMQHERSNHGTINIILILNKPVTPAAQARAVTTMTESKTAALMDLAVPSRASSYMATGTSTDQYIVAAPLSTDGKALQWTGPGTKLGEMIGNAVREATEEALRWQNGLEPSYTRSITRALGRFGLTDAELLKRLRELLPQDSYELLVKNQLGFTMDPRASASAFSYAAVLDRLQNRGLPEAIAQDALRDEAATTAVAVSLKPSLWNNFREQIAPRPTDPLNPFLKGLALGWLARWAQ